MYTSKKKVPPHSSVRQQQLPPSKVTLGLQKGYARMTPPKKNST
jgi:hypothetical protein